MRTKIARHAGFCLGVELALEKLDKILCVQNQENKTSSIATFGPIIHNPLVLKSYAEKNVRIIKSIEEIEENMTVLIRAHGIPKDLEYKIKQNNTLLVDATCPRVKHAQLAIEDATQKTKAKYPSQSILLLYGEQEHPEVQGLLSYSHIPFIVLSQKEDFFPIAKQLPENIILAAQTTQNIEIYAHIKNYLKEHHKGNLIVLDTICDATHKRQEAVKELAKEVDSIIIIGGKKSGNTKRLAQIARNQNKPAIHIERNEELEQYQLDKSSIYGITAGASTPKSHIIEVQDYLESI